MNKLFAIALFLMTSFAQATIIDNGSYTTDTSTGLDFLDLNTVSSGNYASFSSGITYDGRTWELASLSQLDSLFSSIVGYSVVHTGNTFNFSGSGNANSIMDLIGTVAMTGTGYNYFKFNGTYRNIEVHEEGYNDTHLDDFSGATLNAFLVSNTAQVPEPTSLALLCLGLTGFGFARKKKKA